MKQLIALILIVYRIFYQQNLIMLTFYDLYIYKSFLDLPIGFINECFQLFDYVY